MTTGGTRADLDVIRVEVGVRRSIQLQTGGLFGGW